MMPIVLCLVCSHYYQTCTCKAFPDGIPDKILMGEADHTKPFPGDHGIQFEAIT